MRRLLLIFALIILPLQMSWAAVSVYCQHEQGSSTQHVGHHEHKHDASKDGQAKSGEKKIAGLSADDPDCDRCHHANGSVVPAHGSGIVAPLSSTAVASAVLLYQSPIPDTPSRPDWHHPS